MRKAIIIIMLLTAGILMADFPRPWEVVFYTNSTVAYCEVTIDGQPAADEDEVGAFVEGECRGLGYVNIAGNQAVCTMNIQGNTIELIEFAVWDASEDLVCEVSYTTNSLPGGDIGYPPDLLPISAVSDPNQNLAPVWSLPETISWDEDSSFSLDLRDYVFDPEGENLSFSCVDQGDLGVSIYNGNATLTPEENYYGMSELVFSASDGENTVLDTVIAEVISVNDPPHVFMSDDFSFAEDSQLEIDLSAYIIDIDDDELNIFISNNYHILWDVEGMQLTLSAEENWNGTENLQLTVFDGEAMDSDNFLVTVTPVNDPPNLELPEQVSFAEDGELVLNLNIYASDPDGDELEYSIVAGEFLTGELNNNLLTISAEDNWYGMSEISITASDDSSATDSGILPVNVTPVNDAPVIDLPAEFTFEEDNELQLDFSQHVDDIDGDQLSLLVSGNIYISVMIEGLIVTLGAAENWNGSEVVQFTVNDGQDRATASDEVTINVTPVNDPPIINLPVYLSFYTYGELTEDFSSYITDPENDELILEVSGSDNVQIEINGLQVTFSAEPGWFGTEELIFTVNDGELSSDDILLVEVLEQSNLPDIILPETISFAEDTQAVRDFSSYIFNADGFDLTLTVIGNEVIDVVIQGFQVEFSAPPDWWGQEEVIFYLTDSGAGFETIDSVLISVTPVNDPPQINLPEQITFAEDSGYILDCEPYISDLDSENLTLSTGGIHVLLVEITNLVMNISAPANYNGNQDLIVTVNDNENRAIASDTLLVVVEPVNDPPSVELPEELLFAEDEIYPLEIYDYVYDLDGDSLYIEFDSDFGSEFSWAGEIVNIIPPENYNGTGTIYVSVYDPEVMVSGEIYVTIQPVNDAPVIDLPDNFTFEEDTVFSFDIMDYAEDVDGDNLLIDYTGPFFIFVEISGTIVELEPLSNWNGTADMSFSVNDGVLSDTDEVEIIVEPVNDPPSINGFSPAETELLFYGETELIFSVNVYDNDSEVQYEWYINDENQNHDDSEFDITFTENGEYNVMVEVSDEEYQINQQWQVIIYSGPGWELVVYTNSTVAYSMVTIDNEPAGEDDLVGAFVNGECRGIGEVVVVDNVAYSSFLIQGETIEPVNFKVYSAIDEAVYDVLYTTQTNPGGDLGNPPDDLLPLAAYTQPGPGWVPTDQYENWTTVYSIVIIDGEPAAAEDVVGAFDSDGSCLGISTIIIDNDIAYATLDVFQDNIIDFSFKVWDANANSVYLDYTSYETDPGGSIGEEGSEIEISVTSIPGPGWIPVVYTNSTTGYFVIRVDNEPAAENDLLGVFVGNECRGVGNIAYFEEEAVSTVEIQGEQVEECWFQLWDASMQQVLSVELTVETNPGGSVGYPPDEIELEFWNYELPEFQEFPRPWNVVYYTNSTVAYGSLIIDDEPAPADQEIAAFIDLECRGVATTINNGEQTIFTMNIQGDSPEPVQFNYYDFSEDLIYSIEFITITNPGGDIGYPPDLLPLEIFTNFPPVVNLPPGFSFDEDEVVNLDLNEYIFDPDDDVLTFTVSGNENINIEIDGMTVTAWGDENWFGTETVDYTVDDGHDHVINGSLELEVLPVNDPPDVELPYSFTLQEDQELQVDFSLFISDIEGDDWTLSCQNAVYINITIEGSMVTFQPEANWNGEELVTFLADDGSDIGSDDLLVIVNAQPDAPVVDFPDLLTIYENGYLTINYNDYIYDPDGDDFEVYHEGNENITVMVAEDSITFMPLPDWYGSEIITILADDGTTRLIGSDVVEIIVEFVHQPPELFLPDQFTIMEDVPQSFDLTPYFYIYEGEEFEFTATGNDTIILEFEEANLIISAPENWFGLEVVIITLEDEPDRMSVSDTVSIIVEAVNDPPELISWLPEELELEVPEDTTMTFSVVVEDIEGGVGYTWFLDGIEQPEQEPELMITFEEAGDYEVQCMAYDEEEELYLTWDISVYQVDNTDYDLPQAAGITIYPNPFNPSTFIDYSLTSDYIPARLVIYNLKGQVVRSWELNEAGNNRLNWDGCDLKGNSLSSGIYLISLTSQGKPIDLRKITLIK